MVHVVLVTQTHNEMMIYRISTYPSFGRFSVRLLLVSSPYFKKPRKPMTAYRVTTNAMPVLSTPGHPIKFCGVFILFTKDMTTPIFSMAKMTVPKNCGYLNELKI